MVGATLPRDATPRAMMRCGSDAMRLRWCSRSYFEIYNEIIYDLLDPQCKNSKKSKTGGLQVKEHPHPVLLFLPPAAQCKNMASPSGQPV
jgi:hypothetical protein